MLIQLLKKELHLQLSSLYFALGIVLLWIMLMVLALLPPRQLSPQLSMAQLVAMLELFGVAPCLFALIPLFVGSGLAAEERKLGVWDWHLSLPASRVTQWAVKLALASGIVISVSMLLMPLLDYLLARAIGEASGMPCLTDVLNLSAANYLLPLVIMGLAAFVSSFVGDPYKAFFAAIFVFFGIMAIIPIFDPAGILIRWGENIPLPPEIHSWFKGGIGVAYVVCLGAAIACLGYFNFRYEGFRWPRFLLQVIALIAMPALLTCAALRIKMNPMAGYTQDPTYLKTQMEKAGVKPLLVKRPPSPYVSMVAGAKSASFRDLYRLPKTNRLIVEVNSFPSQKRESNQDYYLNYGQQIIEIDMRNSRAHPVSGLIGHVDGIDPKGKGYMVNTGQHFWSFAVGLLPFPVKSNSALWSLVSPPERDWPYSHYYEGRFKSFLTIIPATVKVSLKTADGIALAGSEKDPRTFLLRFDTPNRSDRQGKSSIIDREMGAKYCLSTDKMWYARWPRARVGERDSIQVFSMDHQTTWTIPGNGKDIIIAPDSPEPPSEFSVEQLGYKGAALTGGCPLMRVSQDGRFLPFMRITSGPDFPPTNKRTDFYVLDLQTGKEQHLMNAPAEIASGIHTHSLEPQYPVIVWAPDRDRVAFLYNDGLEIFDCTPGQSKATHVQSADIRDLVISNLDFWDGDTVVVWGDAGLFRLDIKISPAPAL